MTKPIPDGYHAITPHLILKDSRKAIEFYKKAFDAKEIHIMPGPNGQGVIHAEIKIGDSVIMLGDENSRCKSAETTGSSPVTFYLYVKDVDTFFKKALVAGCHIEMPLQDMFWGDRAGTVKDPFGYIWMIATHTKDLTPEEIQKGAENFYIQKK